MDIEFDPDKDGLNKDKHGLSLRMFEEFDLAHAVYIEDRRYVYGEMRTQIVAPLHARLNIAVVTIRNGVFRVISLRKANSRERRMYENHKNTNRES